MRHVFESSVQIPTSAERVFAWHEEPGALAKLIPPGEPIQIVEHSGGIRNGARVVLRMGYPPLALRWLAIHEGYIAGREFRDRQAKGPFRFWLHTHTFLPEGPDKCRMIDHVEFETYLELMVPFVCGKLEKTFAYRHAVTRGSFE